MANLKKARVDAPFLFKRREDGLSTLLLRLAAGASFCAAWLLPNHYPPWASFWQDTLSGLGLIFFVGLSFKGAPEEVKVSRLAILIFGLATVPIIQWIFGKIYFFGDAFIVSLYLSGFGIAISTAALSPHADIETITPLLTAVVIAATASVGLAIVQWLGFGSLSLLIADMRTGARPYANLAQPNQLATLLLLGVVSAMALHEYRRLGRSVLFLLLAWLFFGIAMTQSRTAWVSVAVISIWLIWIRDRAAMRLGKLVILMMFTGFIALGMAWPKICEFLLLSPGRNMEHQATEGTRIEIWTLIIDAIGRQPLLGYGWNQTSVAQFTVADVHAPTAHWLEDSHNLILNLLVANGVPLGALIAIGLALWLFRRASSCNEPGNALAISAIFIVGTHAMFEFPQNYAYFLLPLGIVMGYVDVSVATRRTLSIPRGFFALLTVLALLLMAKLVQEYVQIEDRHRVLRFQMAGFSIQPGLADSESIIFLKQFDALEKYARSVARRNMTPNELDRMRKVTERYGFPPIMFRYALATGLNRDPATAARVLQILCNVHPAERCQEGIIAWKNMASNEYPELLSVDLPRQAVIRNPTTLEHIIKQSSAR